MRFGHVEIFVSEPRKARAFYEKALGFELDDDQGPDYVWMKAPGLLVLLRSRRTAPRPSTYQDAASALAFYTDDLPGELARLQAAGVEICGYDGAECCPTFTDPDGNWIQLVDPRQTHGG